MSTPDFGMEDTMDDARPDYTDGRLRRQDLQADRPVTTLSLRDTVAERHLVVSAHAHQPRRRRRLRRLRRRSPDVRLHRRRPALRLTAAAEDDDLVMLVRTPSGGWLCSDDAEATPARASTRPRPAGTASGSGRSRVRPRRSRAHVSIGVMPGM